MEIPVSNIVDWEATLQRTTLVSASGTTLDRLKIDERCAFRVSGSIAEIAA